MERATKLRADGSLANDETTYRIKPRELRGWEKLKEWLAKHETASATERRTRVAELQTSLSRDFGGAELLQWLAEPEQQFLAQHAGGDVVMQWARLNVATEILDRTKKTPLFTFADARHHPRYMEFDSPANSNAPQYGLAQRDGKLVLTLALLRPDANATGLLQRADTHFTLARSHQLEQVAVRSIKEGGKHRLFADFRSQDGLDQETAELGGSALIFHRPTLEATHPTALANGAIGPVWFKLSATIGEANQEQLKANGKKGTWLTSGPQKRPNHTPPARVLAADLGVRTAASCAVFRLDGADPQKALSLAAEVVAKHERSMKLTLPGEAADKRVLLAREAADQDLRRVRAGITLLKQVRKLARAAVPEVRSSILTTLETPRSGVTPPPISVPAEVIAACRASIDADLKPVLRGPWLALRRELAIHIRDWRRRTRPRKTAPLGGKSAWAIEHLERVRKTLVSWALMRGPDQDDIKRLDRARQGTYAKRLLAHLDGLKDDRVKTTADLIVQAARGIVHEDGRWVRKHPACDVIVLEDLGRYLFQTDRPRHENSQLMRWSHREVMKQVKEQAKVYGIAVAEVPAAFSSRFDAITRAPGIRCEVVTQRTLEFLASETGQQRCEELTKLGIDPRHLALGDLLPRGGGEMFVSVANDGHPRVRHADINAAQNLALRALEAHQVPVRLPATPVADRYVTGDLGVRNQAAFGGKRVVLAGTGPESPAYRAQAVASASAAAKLVGIKSAELAGGSDEERAIDGDDDEAVFEEAMLAAEDAAKKRVTFFRDPSERLFGGLWSPGEIFWSVVRANVVKALKAATDKQGRSLLHG